MRTHEHYIIGGQGGLGGPHAGSLLDGASTLVDPLLRRLLDAVLDERGWVGREFSVALAPLIAVYRTQQRNGGLLFPRGPRTGATGVVYPIMYLQGRRHRKCWSTDTICARPRLCSKAFLMLMAARPIRSAVLLLASLNR